MSTPVTQPKEKKKKRGDNNIIEIHCSFENGA